MVAYTLRLEHALVPFQIAGILAVVVVQFAVREVAYSGLPRPVRAAIEAKFEDARYVRDTRDTEDGRVVHEVTLRRAGRHFEITLTPDGEVVEVETRLTERELPRAVTAAVALRHPGGRVLKAEEVRRDDTVSAYEVCMATGGGAGRGGRPLETQPFAPQRAGRGRGPAPQGRPVRRSDPIVPGGHRQANRAPPGRRVRRVRGRKFRSRPGVGAVGLKSESARSRLG